MKTEAKKIAKESKSSFYLAFNLLPAAQRDAMNTVYAFCRRTDDIVDENNHSIEVKHENLNKWRTEFEKGLQSKSNIHLLNDLSSVIEKFDIPLEPFFDLIKGMEMDIQQNRFHKFDDLLEYCYRAASTVGLMSIEIFGYKNESAKKFAINLGYALQLTNILRDVKKDADYGRIYLPLEDLEKFGYTEDELLQNMYNDNFVNLMQFEADRVKKYFEIADNSLNIEDRSTMFSARAMQHIYFNLLKKLEAKKFDVFNENIKVSKISKTIIALGVWAKYRFIY